MDADKPCPDTADELIDFWRRRGALERLTKIVQLLERAMKKPRLMQLLKRAGWDGEIDHLADVRRKVVDELARRMAQEG